MDSTYIEIPPDHTNRKFSSENIDEFIEFARVMKGIFIRLINEGYTIKDGVMTRPPHKLTEMKAEKLKQKRGRKPKGCPNIL